MSFNQLSTRVVNLLPELDDLFGGVHFLDVTRLPTLSVDHFIPVAPATTGKFLPIAELPLVLLARVHPLHVS